jgi:DNA-binding NarL/FixJ family response regulator
MSSRMNARAVPAGLGTAESFPESPHVRERHHDPPVLHTVTDPQAESARVASLTSIEREMVPLIAQGMKDGHIATRLHMGEATVQYYLRAISDKLACPDRLELIVYAYWQGLA